MTRPYVRACEEVAAALLLGYVTLALYYRAREAAGLLTCDCYQDCWCRKPGLSIFRWVLPRYHHNPGLTEEEKRVLELLARGRTSKEMAAELAISPTRCGGTCRTSWRSWEFTNGWRPSLAGSGPLHLARARDLIDCEEDRTLRALLAMLRGAERSGPS